MLDKILDTYGQRIVDGLKDNLKTINASGDLSKSISFELKILTEKYTLSIKLLDYYKWVDEGRKPGKWPGKYPSVNPNNILEWIQTKPGIIDKITQKTKTKTKRGTAYASGAIDFKQAKSIAFLISRKIKEKGIKPTYFLTDVFEEQIPKLTKDLEKALAKDIVITIKAA